MTAKRESPEAQLSSIFGGYRAEWLKEQIFELFTEPAYFPELSDARPCMLIGGRGTGKTTVLRGLSYEGQFALHGQRADLIADWRFFGMYYRVNTNRVTAFRGNELHEDQWIPLFAHYMNLLLCDMILRFVNWYQLQTGTFLTLSLSSYAQIGSSLHLSNVGTLKELFEALQHHRVQFEAAVNNVADASSHPLSLQGAPVDILIRELSALPAFTGKSWYFLIDEYENFEPYQQQVMNTLIKHSGELYTFKIGVRELGIRRKNTLNPNEQLISPSDYVRIDIAEKLKGRQFEEFALQVCNDRVRRLSTNSPSVLNDIRQILPHLSEDEEAEKLGVIPAVQGIRNAIIAARPDAADLIELIAPLRLYFLSTWARVNSQTILQVFDDSLQEPALWEDRYANYKHSLLYALNKGKRGLRRYYAGWSVFVLMAASNIRYLLELVDQSLLAHLASGLSFDLPVSAEDQTYAAQRVGKKNLAELEGLSVFGARLTKLLLGLGRVFGQMAADPAGHAPEVNQFHLADSSNTGEMPTPAEAQAVELLEAAIMHLALLRWPGNKLGAEGDTKDYDYAVHPVFSAFFVFSYRKKRKMTLAAQDLLGLVSTPQRTIRDVLRRSDREMEPLPEQLEIFKGFYENP